MPDRLTERVSAAIAAEAEQRGAGLNAVRAGQSANSVNTDVGLDDGRSGVPAQTGPVNVPGRPDLPERSRRRQGRSRRSVWTSPLVMGGLAATGIFAFVVVGAYALSQAGLGSSSSSAPSAARGAGPKAIPKPGPRESSSSGKPGSGVHSPVYGVGQPVYSTTGVQLKYNASGKTRTATVYASPARYTRGNIARGVRSGLTFGLNLPDAGPAHPGPAGTHPPQPHKVGSVSFGQLAGCLSSVAPANGVLIVEIAHYLGKQAIIVVGRPVAKVYQVTVTGLACSAARPDVVARITVPEPR
jgi:hypothetical protein